MKVCGRIKYINTDGKRFKYEGNCSFDDIISARDITAEGDIFFSKIKGDKITLEGKVQGNDIQGKSLFIAGQVNLKNIIFEQVDMLLSQKNIIEKIHCTELKIALRKENNPEIVSRMFKIIFGKKLKLNKKVLDKIFIDKIVAENVMLNNCYVDEIRCKNLTVLNGCVINKVLYENICNIQDGSIIKNKIKL